MDEEHSRELGENMQSAYNLLPSPAYFNVVSDFVATFDSSVDKTYPFTTFYGSGISTPIALKLFLTGEAGGRNEPSPNDEESPNVLKYDFLQKAIDTRAY